MTTGEIIRRLSKYPEDTVLYVTCWEMVQERDVHISETDYDPDGGTLDIDIY